MHPVLQTEHTSSATHGSPAASGLLPGLVLAFLACLPIAGTLLVAQILPQLEDAFANTPHVRLRVSLALTIPALAIAIFSWGSGWLADRVGKRRLLLLSLAGYAAFGLAPFALNNLDTLIATRAGMGVMESIIMTCSTALIGDHYSDDGRRQKLLSLQTAFASIAAVVFAMLGGALGELGWRAPFGVYALALIALPMVIIFVPDIASVPATVLPEKAPAGARLPLGALLPICLVTFAASICFYVAQIQTPYLLNTIHPVSPAVVGLVSAITNAAVVAGSLSFVMLRRLALRTISLLCFVLLACGLAASGAAHGEAILCAGLTLASFAGGIALPTFLNAAMRLLSPAQRGAGAGLWQSSFWGGQFLSPVLVVVATGALGTLTDAVMASAGFALLGGALLSFWQFRDRVDVVSPRQ